MFEDLWRKSSLLLNMALCTLNTRLIKHLRNDTPSADPVIRLVQPTTVVVVLRGAAADRAAVRQQRVLESKPRGLDWSFYHHAIGVHYEHLALNHPCYLGRHVTLNAPLRACS
jgi:hypothetical protein